MLAITYFSDWPRSDMFALIALVVSLLSILIAIGIPIVGAYLRRPKLGLSLTWRHQPGDPNHDKREDVPWAPIQKERYCCEFCVRNIGVTGNQISEVELLGKQSNGTRVNFTDMIIGGGGKFIDLPKDLAPGQALKFTYWFSPEQYEEMGRRPHFLVVTSAHTFRFRISTKI